MPLGPEVPERQVSNSLIEGGMGHGQSDSHSLKAQGFVSDQFFRGTLCHAKQQQVDDERNLLLMAQLLATIRSQLIVLDGRRDALLLL